MTHDEDEDIDLNDFIAGDDKALEFDVADFEFNDTPEKPQSRYIKPKFSKTPMQVDYKNAQDLVHDIKLFPGEQLHAIVDGNFVFGDFIESLLYDKKCICEHMHLSTLSLSQENIDSLAGMLNDGTIKKLTLVLSNYFYSHEKHVLIKYLLKELDHADRLDVIIIRNHTKICLMEIRNIRIVLTGSSNLRSSRSIEQFCLQESKTLYKFYETWFNDKRPYSIINKEVSK